MATLLDWPPLPIPINTRSRQQAEAFARAASATEAKAVYERAIATLAVQHYLRLVDVPHWLETEPSGPVLFVEELNGHIACCAVSANADKCTIPEADRTQRKGYLFVELSEPFYQASILGFVPTLSVNQLPLSYLQPLSAFIESLDTPVTRPAISIPDWAKGLIDGWQTLHELSPALQPAVSPAIAMRSLQPDPLQLGQSQLGKPESPTALIEVLNTTTDDVARWQAAEKLAKANPPEASGAPASLSITHPIFQAKLLADELNGLSVALLVGVVVKPDRTFLVGCRLYGVGDRTALPDNLSLHGIEESSVEGSSVETKEESAAGSVDFGNQTFCKLTPTVHGDPLEYLFTAEGGDRFSLQVHYLQSTSTSTFVLPISN